MVNSFKRLLSVVSPFYGACRFTSNKYFRPHPRSYKRRLYEAALKPSIPAELAAKKELLENGDLFDFQPETPPPWELTEVDLAEVRMIREWIKGEKFRVLGICQILFVAESPRWLAQNQFRLHGLEFKSFQPKIISKVFDGTPFSALSMLHDDNTALLFGREPETIRTLVTECAKHSWITLLAGTLDRRIFDVATLKKFAELSSLEDIRAETTQILGQLPTYLIQSLEHIPRELVGNIDSICREPQQCVAS